MGFEFHEAEFHWNCWRINNYVLSAGFHCVSWITEPTELIIGADLALRAGWFRFITTSSVTDRIGKIEYKLQQSRITESPLIYITNNLRESSPELREIVRYTYNQYITVWIFRNKLTWTPKRTRQYKLSLSVRKVFFLPTACKLLSCFGWEIHTASLYHLLNSFCWFHQFVQFFWRLSFHVFVELWCWDHTPSFRTITVSDFTMRGLS